MTSIGDGLPDPLELDNPLWRFALAAWRIPEVEQQCLELQARQWSVTRILVACWLASEGRHYGPEDESVSRWRHQVTTTLRALKKQIPRHQSELAALRERLAGAELEAERVELALAYESLQRPGKIDRSESTPAELARLNLQSAAPAPIIDPETGRLLEALIRHLPPESPYGVNGP